MRGEIGKRQRGKGFAFSDLLIEIIGMFFEETMGELDLRRGQRLWGFNWGLFGDFHWRKKALPPVEVRRRAAKTISGRPNF